VNLDELARSTGRRTTATLAASTEPAAALRDLTQMRHRRAAARAAAAAASVVLLFGLWWGSPGLPFLRSAPPATPRPHPAPTKPFLAAPPLCGPQRVTVPFDYDAAVAAGPCPSGPGRYLSLNLGVSTEGAYAFTLPPGWTVKAIPTGGSPGPESLSAGLQLSSTRTGSTIAFTTYPNPPGPQDGERHDWLEHGKPARDILTPAEYVQQAASNPAVMATPIPHAAIGGRPAAGADIRFRPGARHRDHCLIGDGCAAVFTVWAVATPGLGAFGIFPDRPSRLIAFKQPGIDLPVIAWMWGPPGASSVTDDPDLIRLFNSITFANDAHLIPW
jgi:hypothetical protein